MTERLPTEAASRAAASIWRVRERTEHEAAILFGRLATDLEACGAPGTLIDLASRCSADETRHATHCRAIVDALAPELAPLVPDRLIRLGAHESALHRALFASVALGCVTESLSTALLLEMRPHAGPAVVREALDTILEDEVRHSRLGWAHLAFEASRGDVSFLAPSVPDMLRAALDTEHAAPRSQLTDPERESLRAWGILPSADVARITEATLAQVVIPGLARFGIHARPVGPAP